MRRLLCLALAAGSLAGAADAQQRPADPQRGAGSARHTAAQLAGVRALHFCTGYFATEAPRALIDATVATNANPVALEGVRTEVDEKARAVLVHFDPAMPPRIAVARPPNGCTMLPIGATLEMARSFPRVAAAPPKLDDRAWPMGDRDARAALPAAKAAAVEKVIDEAFRDANGPYGGVTWGVVVVRGGRIVAERYQHGFGPRVSARTNSMCKSIGGTLVGIGVRKGLLATERKGLLAEWRTPGDPRGEIKLDNLMRMASGLYAEGPGDRQPEIYRSGAAVADVAATNTADSRPGSRFVYAGTDSLLAVRALHQAVKDDARFLAFPYRELLWKIGMTRTVVEADWKNDLLVSGQCWSTARDFGRFGMLYLADGVWNGERLLPVGWSRYVSSPNGPQPVRPSIGGDAGFGAQFWLYGGLDGLSADAYAPFGSRGQYAMIVPSQDLVVVRRGFDAASQFRIARFSADVVRALAD